MCVRGEGQDYRRVKGANRSGGDTGCHPHEGREGSRTAPLQRDAITVEPWSVLPGWQDLLQIHPLDRQGSGERR